MHGLLSPISWFVDYVNMTRTRKTFPYTMLAVSEVTGREWEAKSIYQQRMDAYIKQYLRNEITHSS